jgi:hypothetical protein
MVRIYYTSERELSSGIFFTTSVAAPKTFHPLRPTAYNRFLSLRQTLVVPPNWTRSACLLFAPGAFDHEDEARQHLSTARLKLGDTLTAADPLTERVQLRRSDIDCIALKN